MLGSLAGSPPSPPGRSLTHWRRRSSHTTRDDPAMMTTTIWRPLTEVAPAAVIDLPMACPLARNGAGHEREPRALASRSIDFHAAPRRRTRCEHHFTHCAFGGTSRSITVRGRATGARPAAPTTPPAGSTAPVRQRAHGAEGPVHDATDLPHGDASSRHSCRTPPQAPHLERDAEVRRQHGTTARAHSLASSGHQNHVVSHQSATRKNDPHHSRHRQ